MVLGILEVKGAYNNETIGNYIYIIFKEFGIEFKIGYFILNNANIYILFIPIALIALLIVYLLTLNNITFDHLGNFLYFNGRFCWVRCLKHIFNLVNSRLLFNTDYYGFKDLIKGDKINAIRKYKE